MMKNILKTICLFTALSLISACSSSPKKLSPTELKQGKQLSKFLGSPIAKPSNKNVLFSLSQFYGAPQHQEFSKKPSPIDPSENEKVYTLVYEGFEINVAEKVKKKDESYYLRRLVVHDNVLKLPYGVKIGQKTDQLTRLFGEPQAIDKENSQISYCNKEKEGACVKFQVDENKVQRIIWDYQK